MSKHIQIIVYREKMRKYNTTCCRLSNVSESCIGNCMDDDNVFFPRSALCDQYEDSINKCTFGWTPGNYIHYSITAFPIISGLDNVLVQFFVFLFFYQILLLSTWPFSFLFLLAWPCLLWLLAFRDYISNEKIKI